MTKRGFPSGNKPRQPVSESAKARDLNPVRFETAPAHEPIALARGGVPLGRIVVHRHGELTDAAVQDLQSLVEATTGARLPVVAERGDCPAIIVGDCPAAAEAGLVGVEMPVDGFAIKTAPAAIYILGNDDAGTAWGVYEFLERFVGVRWYWPDNVGCADSIGTSVIEGEDLIVSPVWLTDAPVFRKRHTWPFEGSRVGKADVKAQERRLRAHNSWPVNVIVHSPRNWAKYYAETRPDIFEMHSDGVRRPIIVSGDKMFSMLCYGSPMTLQTYLEEIEFQLGELAAGRPVEREREILDGTAVTVSPADMEVTCHCEHCRALWNERGGIYGSASRIMGDFVNRLGSVVKRRWPELTIIYLPYNNYTKPPEGLVFPGNVEVQICGMPGMATYKDPIINAAEQASIDAWFHISGRRIQNWHYSCWPEIYTRAAYQFPHVIQEHYRANRGKTVGSFINGIKNHWPRMHLSYYAWLKVLWNPEFDVDAAIEEYCRRMYGSAVGTMRKAIAMLTDGWESSAWPDNSFSPRSVYEFSYPERNIVSMRDLWTTARKEAGGETTLIRRRIDYWFWCMEMFFDEASQYAHAKDVDKLSLKVYQLTENPPIDDTLDDGAWRGIEPVFFTRARDLAHPECAYPTAMKAAWSPDGVTFAFRMSEPQPEKLSLLFGPGVRDVSPFLLSSDDSVTLLLDVAGQRAGCCQFIVNANGAVSDARNGDLSWDAAGMRVATAIGGDCWTLQVFLPVSAFEDAIRPEPGAMWFGNFTRHRVGDRTATEDQRFHSTYLPADEDQNAFVPIRFIGSAQRDA